MVWSDEQKAAHAKEQAEYAAYRRTGKWWAKRDAVMKRAGGICEFENETGEDGRGPTTTRCTHKAVHVHHLTYEHIFNEPLEDLQALCDFHHKVTHVWDRGSQCERCGENVFDSVSDAADHVAAYEDYDLEALYADAPHYCPYCCHMMDKDD